jgi:CheY-like chemotaxis protein
MRQIEASAPDVLITDVEMPEMDGFQLTEAVRGRPATAKMPVIMITAADDRHSADAARVGVTVLLGKPYPEDQLLAHIESTLGLASAAA